MQRQGSLDVRTYKPIVLGVVPDPPATSAQAIANVCHRKATRILDFEYHHNIISYGLLDHFQLEIYPLPGCRFQLVLGCSRIVRPIRTINAASESETAIFLLK